MRETLLKLLDMCKETDGISFELGTGYLNGIRVVISRGNKIRSYVISREALEKYDNPETIIKTVIEMLVATFTESEVGQ